MDEPKNPKPNNKVGDMLARPVPVPAAGVPVWAVAGGIVAAVALGMVIGARVGKAVGRAQLGPVSKVEPIIVERCAECAERHRADGAVKQAAATVTPLDVERMVRAQVDVEHAA